MPKQREVTIVFEGVPGSGKTTLLRIVAKAIAEAGHEVWRSNNPDSHTLKVSVVRGALPFEAPPEPPTL